MEDSTIVNRAKKGNEHAFRMLIETYKQDVFRCVYGVLQNPKDAEDASQEVWLKIFASLPSYEGKGFKSWITKIAVRHAIDCKRKHARHSEALYDAMDDDIIKEKNNVVEESVFLNEQKQLVLSSLEQIPTSYREILEGFYIKEKTHQELAEEQNVQVKTIEVKLYRARSWIRKRWKEDDFR
ncbi:RNA polymerase sigma factor [Pseudalkalibacillus sp. SCS-8]|uniref:RNA polymerase sigma factor n=1 Tax=Pseudalkalibacillus nanhaiensis TaxID=3115291 RepID=UPI0032DB6BB7